MNENITPLTRQVEDEDTIVLADKVIKGGMEHNFYTYKLEDGYVQIVDEGGTNILILQDIHSDSIEVKKRADGFFVVLHKAMPILEFQGIEYIQLMDGCYNIHTRWGA
jgi:hypothetical protein